MRFYLAKLTAKNLACLTAGEVVLAVVLILALCALAVAIATAPEDNNHE